MNEEMKEIKGLIDEEELYEEQPQEEEKPEEKLELKDLKLEEALYYIGLLAANVRKAPDKDAFAQTYAAMTSSMLKLVGFEEALAQTLPSALANPKIRLILGLGIIAAGVFITPVDITQEVTS